MGSSGTQVNVRLTAEDVAILDNLRESQGGGVSRADVLRSLLRSRRRWVVDEQIAAAYDRAYTVSPSVNDDALAQASADAAGEALTGV